MAGKGVSALLSLFYLGLAARTLGAEGFGRFSLILGAGQAVAALVGFQTWQIVVRFGLPLLDESRELNDGREPALARLVGFCLGLDLAAAGIGCVVASAFVAFLGPRLGWPADLSRAGLAFCFVILLSVRSTAVGILRLHDRFGVGASSASVTPVMRFLGALAVAAVGASVRRFLLAWAAGEIVTAIVYWGCAKKIAPGSLALPSARAFRLVPLENIGIWRFAWITNVNATMDSGSRQLVILLVGLVSGPIGAGQYRLAYQLSQGLTRVSDMLSRAVFLELARIHTSSAGSDFKRLLRQATGMASLAAVAVVLLVLLIGRPVLHFVAGTAYVSAYPLLLLLGLASALDLAGVGFEPALTAMGLPERASQARIAATLCLLGVLSLLLPRQGTIGAAESTLVASGFALALFAAVAWHAMRRR